MRPLRRTGLPLDVDEGHRRGARGAGPEPVQPRRLEAGGAPRHHGHGHGPCAGRTRAGAARRRRRHRAAAPGHRVAGPGLPALPGRGDDLQHRGPQPRSGQPRRHRRQARRLRRPGAGHHRARLPHRCLPDHFPAARGVRGAGAGQRCEVLVPSRRALHRRRGGPGVRRVRPAGRGRTQPSPSEGEDGDVLSRNRLGCGSIRWRRRPGRGRSATRPGPCRRCRRGRRRAAARNVGRRRASRPPAGPAGSRPG